MHSFSIVSKDDTDLDRSRPLRSQPQIDIESTERRALYADALLRLSGDQQDREAFRLATTSRFGEMGHTFQLLVPTRGTDLSGEGDGEDDGEGNGEDNGEGNDADEEVTVIQKKRKCC